MHVLETNEIVLFLASPCNQPSTLIWVGGLSEPKVIPIGLIGSVIKQVVPFTIKTNDGIIKYYIIVTDKETVVFKPIFTSIN